MTIRILVQLVKCLAELGLHPLSEVIDCQQEEISCTKYFIFCVAFKQRGIAELLYLTSCKDLFTDTIKQRSEEQLSEKEKEKHFTLMM
ncbi:hypothetical protein T02_2818 [Trichinella nativa]|uniref:Uncharacterized protein n=1 Tax=Trichinella nativa TaxID=6335 RepID=A0A0V1L977_9BILA|nr:hypothetical protein T02_2818 [Trichinella nativa]